jgi:hypothetical protein
VLILRNFKLFRSNTCRSVDFAVFAGVFMGHGEMVKRCEEESEEDLARDREARVTRNYNIYVLLVK